MAKKKKKANKNFWNGTFRKLVKDNQLLIAVVGAAAGGAALTAAISSGRGQQMLDTISDSVNNWLSKDETSTASVSNQSNAKKGSSPSPSPAAAT